MQGGNSWGGGGGWGATAPQLLANNTFFGFSHNTDRKVASEVVLMGSFMSVIYGNFRLLFSKKNCRITNIGGLRGGDISGMVENDVHLLGFGLEML